MLDNGSPEVIGRIRVDRPGQTEISLNNNFSGSTSLVERAMDRLLRPFAWQLRRAQAPLDLRGHTDDPVHGLYLAGGRHFVIEVATARLRGLVNLAFPGIQGSGDPYVETVAAYLRGKCSSYRGSPIEAFYSAWKPRNAAEAIGLDVTATAPALRRLGSHFVVLPWSRLSPEEEVRRSTVIARAENARNGQAHLGVEHGTLNFGITPGKGQIEFERLRRIADSMKARGYCRSDSRGGDVAGYLLIDGADWAISIRRGLHRTAVATAMGLERLPVRIGSNNPAWSVAGVRRGEARCWPNVRSGLFTVDQALAVFDRVFEGRQPEGCPRLDELWPQPAPIAGALKNAPCAHGDWPDLETTR